MLEKVLLGTAHSHANQRVGLEKTVLNRLCLLRNLARVSLSSSSFGHNRPIPKRYTADGAGLSPPLQWSNAPVAQNHVLIVEDADVQAAHPRVHAIVVNLSGFDGSLEEGALASEDHEGSGTHTGFNSLLSQSWLPPDPAPGDGEHRYAFQLFALGHKPVFNNPPGRLELIESILELAVGGGCLIGTYERPASRRGI